jgi:4-carboxymuconolactone decarboxylase
MTDAYTKMMQQMLESGQDMMRAFQPMMDKAGITGFKFDGAFPTMPAEFMEMWFGRTFNRDGLDAKTRLLVTLGALTAQGAIAEPQIRLTVRHALAAGATQREIAETIWQMAMFGGMPAMQKALEIAQSVFAETEETKE